MRPSLWTQVCWRPVVQNLDTYSVADLYIGGSGLVCGCADGLYMGRYMEVALEMCPFVCWGGI